MKRVYTFHPYIFTIYGVLSLFANNITEINISLLRVILFSTIACTFVMLLLLILLRDVVKASLISSVSVLLIFTYGHAKSAIQAISTSDPSFLINLLSLTWWILLIFWVYVVLRVLKSYEMLTKYFFSVSIILIIFPLYSLFGFYFQRIGKDKQMEAFLQDSWNYYGISEAERVISSQENSPDIYYIVLDAYARSDILDEFYGYENDDFHQSLESRGFYVAEQSRSNYSQTSFSLSSSMNMMLINSLPEYVTRGLSFNKDWLVSDASIEILQNNRLMEILKRQGYQIVSFDTGFESINFPDADFHMTSPIVENSIYTSRNFFEVFFMDTFVGEILNIVEPSDRVLVSSMYDAHRKRILYIFDNLNNFASLDGSFFIFAHIIAPHPPYVFGPNGEEIGSNEVFTLDDVARSNRDYELYIGELQYVNILVLETIDRIMRESDEPPIIIIQSDHGSRLYPGDNPTNESRDKMLFPILNAYHLPEIDAESVLYPSISPVNSFRIILNNYFGANLELITDQSFDWDRSTDYEFLPVCGADC